MSGREVPGLEQYRADWAEAAVAVDVAHARADVQHAKAMVVAAEARADALARAAERLAKTLFEAAAQAEAVSEA